MGEEVPIASFFFRTKESESCCLGPSSKFEEVVTSSALCIRLGSLHFIQECTGESDLVSGVWETVGAEPVVEEGVVLLLSDAELFPVER